MTNLRTIFPFKQIEKDLLETVCNWFKTKIDG